MARGKAPPNVVRGGQQTAERIVQIATPGVIHGCKTGCFPMPLQYVIDIPENLIRETWSGSVNLEQLFDSCQLEWADPNYRKLMNMLSDFRAAKLDVSHEELRGFADYMGRHEAVQRHAIVVSRQVGFGVARMFTSLSEASSPYWNSLRVFFDFDEAERWLSTSPAGERPAD